MKAIPCASVAVESDLARLLAIRCLVTASVEEAFFGSELSLSVVSLFRICLNPEPAMTLGLDLMSHPREQSCANRLQKRPSDWRGLFLNATHLIVL
jgi:hypothetical protein